MVIKTIINVFYKNVLKYLSTIFEIYTFLIAFLQAELHICIIMIIIIIMRLLTCKVTPVVSFRFLDKLSFNPFLGWSQHHSDTLQTCGALQQIKFFLIYLSFSVFAVYGFSRSLAQFPEVKGKQRSYYPVKTSSIADRFWCCQQLFCVTPGCANRMSEKRTRKGRVGVSEFVKKRKTLERALAAHINTQRSCASHRARS